MGKLIILERGGDELNNRSNNKGMTLIEVIVALAILLFAKLFDGSVFNLNDAEYLIFQGCLQNT